VHASILEVRPGPLLLCLAISGGAAAAGHRDRAQIAESTGHAAQAAKEYEQAYAEENDPDLLYRLGLVRRKLKQYELAQEAFRGYLRTAPDGPFRDEVMRQLSEIGVLLEERHRQVPDEQHKKPRPQHRNVPVKGLTPPPATPEPPTQSATANSSPEHDASPSVTAGLDPPPPSSSTSAPPLALPPAFSTSAMPSTVAPVAAADDAAIPAPADSAAAAVSLRTAVTPAPAVALATTTVPAPETATRTPLAVQQTISPRSRAAPWVAASAAALAIGGAALWWDGDRTASDLDARYASGDLSGADNGTYARARRESIAGRAMVAGALALGAVAVALWW
jgi:hypothetical protein